MAVSEAVAADPGVERRSDRLPALDLAAARGFLLPFLAVLPLAFFDGGYWPTAWGWAGLALAWTPVLPLVLVREAPRLGPFDLAFVGGLAVVFAWILGSALWSSSPGRAIAESQRSVVYLAGVAALLLLVRGRHYPVVLAALAAAVALTATYALTTKLLPGSFERFDSIAGYRLADPIGYWNALGAFCALGILLAIGLVAHFPSTVARALAAASLPILLVALYFTFSRGAWLGLGAGALALAGFESRRLRVATVVLPLSLPAGLALAAAYRSAPLTERGASLERAIDAGRDLGVVLLLASAGSALIALGLGRIEHHLEPTPRARRFFAGLLLVGILAAGAFGLVRAGGPVGLFGRAGDGFRAPPIPVPVGESANQRLFSLSNSGRIVQWRVAREQFAQRRLVGTGAGTHELYWVANRPLAATARDAHSLYLETLAELGIVGMGLLGFALAVPLGAALVARRRPLVPAAAAAYIVFLAHAAVDWDWEVPALTLGALLCGGSIVLAARGDVAALSTRARAAGVAAALAVSAFALAGLIGSSALAEGWDALGRGGTASARDHAAVAERWSPWSSEPLRLAAAAASLDEDDATARHELRRAVEREPDDWNGWFELAQVSAGAEARFALGQALRLNPLGPELAEYLEANEIPRPDPLGADRPSPDRSGAP